MIDFFTDPYKDELIYSAIARYHFYSGNKDFKCSVAGRCCESGDMIAENIILPKVKSGDILAVCTTGAYNYSMASNYNRLPKPPVVMINEKADYIAVKRETFDDIIRNDI